MKYNGEQYLRSEHLLRDGKYISATVKIAAVIDDCPLKDRTAIGVKFERSEKVLALNKTNESLICIATGNGDSSSWIGKPVTLVVRLIKNKKTKQMEPCIRVWPNRPIQNARITEQMGVEIPPDWYQEHEPMPNAAPEQSRAEKAIAAIESATDQPTLEKYQLRLEQTWDDFTADERKQLKKAIEEAAKRIG